MFGSEEASVGGAEGDVLSMLSIFIVFKIYLLAGKSKSHIFSFNRARYS